jgi:ABC-2 type transport system ATP-binding protein
MSEMAMTAEDLVVVGRGRLIAQTTVADVVDRAGGGRVEVRTTEPDRLRALLRDDGLEVQESDAGRLLVTATSTDEVGRLAARHAVTLLELTAVQGSLEEAYLAMTADAAQYVGARTLTAVAA